MITVSCFINMANVQVDGRVMSELDTDRVFDAVRSTAGRVATRLDTDGTLTVTTKGSATLIHDLYSFTWREVIVPLLKGENGVKITNSPTFEHKAEVYSDMYVYGDVFSVTILDDWYVYRTGKSPEFSIGEIAFQRVNDVIMLRNWHVAEQYRGIGYGKQLMAQALKSFVYDVGAVSKIRVYCPKIADSVNLWFREKFNAVHNEYYDCEYEYALELDACKLYGYLDTPFTGEMEPWEF